MRLVLPPIAWVALALGWLLATPTPSQAQQANKRVPRVTTLGDWRHHDPESPLPGREPWTVEDVARFLQRFAEHVFVVGAWDAYPIGNRYAVREAPRVRALRAELQRRGIDFEQRVCLAFRPDVARIGQMSWKHCDPALGWGGCDVEGAMDGSLGEKEVVVKASGAATGGTEASLADEHAAWYPGRWTHRLLVLRPGRSNEERRRIVGNDAHQVWVDRAWSQPPNRADRYEIRGSFDPRWVQLVPRERHEWALDRLWEGARDICVGPGGRCKPPAEPLDPLHPRNRRAWPSWLDREPVLALVTPTHAPALYGQLREGPKPGVLDDPYFEVSAVVMRLDDPGYRDWAIRNLLYKLRDHGFTPGNGPCLLVQYKPGWHAYYDEEKYGPSTDQCAVKGSNMWTGPTHYCVRPSSGKSSRTRFAPTPYGPGEFEQAISAFFLELVGTLKSHGYQKPRIITVERPTFRGSYWTTLLPEVRNHPALAGEKKGSLHPPLSLIRSTPPTAPGAAPPDPASPTSPPAASAPPASVGDASEPVAAVPGSTIGDGSTSSRQSHDWSIGSSKGGRSPAQRSSTPRGRGGDVVGSSGGGGGTVEAPSLRR